MWELHEMMRVGRGCEVNHDDANRWLAAAAGWVAAARVAEAQVVVSVVVTPPERLCWPPRPLAPDEPPPPNGHSFRSGESLCSPIA